MMEEEVATYAGPKGKLVHPRVDWIPTRDDQADDGSAGGTEDTHRASAGTGRGRDRGTAPRSPQAVPR